MNCHTAVDALFEPGRPTRLGAHFNGGGTNFAVFSQHATQVYLCLFSPDGKREERRLPLPERTGDIWHGYLPGLRPGTLYGYRADGPYAPDQGHRFNLHKLLLDPYTRELRGGFTNHPTTYGYRTDAAEADLIINPCDSAAHVPKSVVSNPDQFRPDAQNLQRPWEETQIYEAHVKGTTIRHPGIHPSLRGTFEGMAAPAMLDHLTRLGVTAVELLPVQALKSEGGLAQRGLVNYWGYNTIGFFAPEPRYFGPMGVQGFRAMVSRFHSAGIEVILDVVYNHTAEGDHLGQTLCFRGLDNAAYYRLQDGDPRHNVNDTGCGNTLDVSHPFVLRMVMDSLRFWVEVMGVDGFRFDLATTLGREAHGFDPNGGFLDALRQDPVLAGVKLIAEPWDIGPGGYQLGQFPPEFAEWNDTGRDTYRRFWRGDQESAQALGSALLGSSSVFERPGRRTWAAINYAASHDGYTLADLTCYERRHNHANGENNRDGHKANFSENFGVEGATDDPVITASRQQRQRNLLATVFLSQGTPMLLAGDEGGQSQQGNNNAYCQDNETSWIDWEALDPDMIAFTAALTRFRHDHPVLRQSQYLHGAARASDGQRDVEWRDFDGSTLDWHDPDLSGLCLHLRGCAECLKGDALRDEVLIAINRSSEDRVLDLPNPGARVWTRAIDTNRAHQGSKRETARETTLKAHTLVAFCLTGDEA